MKFTDTMIRALRPKAARYEIWESRGFGIRVTLSGEKSFVFLYRFGGKARRLTLGRYPAMSLVDAHAAHGGARQALERGIDPGAKKIEAKRIDRDALTVADLAEEYLEKWARPRKRSWREDERIIRKDILPSWKTCKAKDITRRDVITLLDRIAERGATIQANRTLAVVRKMFNFALGRSILEVSPCVAIQAPAKENRRDRVLSAEEIRAFWNGLAGSRMAEGTRLALKLQFVTGQRKGEVAGAEWADIDLSGAWWTIPAEKAKNGLPHRIPLSAMALEILARIKELSGESRWLFPGARQDRHVTEPAINHAVRGNQDVFGFHFTPHDLRRTAASLMTGAGVPRLTVAKILNHVEGGVTAVYDRHGYDDEKRQALETWGRKLSAILTGQAANIIPFHRAAE